MGCDMFFLGQTWHRKLTEPFFYLHCDGMIQVNSYMACWKIQLFVPCFSQLDTSTFLAGFHLPCLAGGQFFKMLFTDTSVGSSRDFTVQDLGSFTAATPPLWQGLCNVQSIHPKIVGSWDPQKWLVVCTSCLAFSIFLDIKWLDPNQLYVAGLRPAFGAYFVEYQPAKAPLNPEIIPQRFPQKVQLHP